MEVYRGAREYDSSFDEALHALCRSWLEPCAFADGWIETQLTRGFEIENLVRFRQCADEMIAMVAAWESEQQALPGAIAELRDAAIGEHHDGETAEFI